MINSSVDEVESLLFSRGSGVHIWSKVWIFLLPSNWNLSLIDPHHVPCFGVTPSCLNFVVGGPDELSSQVSVVRFKDALGEESNLVLVVVKRVGEALTFLD